MIEFDINKRWEQGVDHHMKSVEVVKAMADIDFNIGGDSLGITMGGDGDNGEAMMYALDIYFDCQDAGIDYKVAMKKYLEQ